MLGHFQTGPRKRSSGDKVPDHSVVGASNIERQVNAIDLGPDRLVICPSCGGFMRVRREVLSPGKNNLQRFECEWCGQRAAAEAEYVLPVLERSMF